MLNNKSYKIVFFLIIPVLVAAISFFYNFAGPLFTPGPLTLGHKEFDNSCFKCHMPLISVSTSCLSCHKETEKSIGNKDGFHGNMEKEDVKKCLQCHTDHIGPNSFIIKDNRTTKEFQRTLIIIREKNYLSADQNGDKVKPEYNTLWKKVAGDLTWDNRLKTIQEDFEHKLTGYPLIGGHAKVKCQECHRNIKDFKASAKEGLLPSFAMEKIISKDFCYSCHKKDDEGKKGHKEKYGKNCALCHMIGGVDSGWKVLMPKIKTFHEDPKYELKGHHKKTSCQKCHEYVPFKKKIEETTCVHCHEVLDKKFHEQTLGKKCEDCHNALSFRKSTFDHQKTPFIIKGAHKKTRCQKCHSEWDENKGKKKIYKSLKSVACFDCHAKDDIHHGAFQKDCGKCHKDTYWGDVTQR